MTAPLIRPACLDDAAAIAAIYAHAVSLGTATFELDVPAAAEMAQRVAKIVDAGFPYLVAEDAGTVAGYAYAAPYHPRPAYRFTVEDSIYVADAAQRRGIGRALLDRLVRECSQRGARQMIAVIGDPSRQGASVRLHAAAGFRVMGTLPATGYKFGRWLDTVLMQRALGDGSSTHPSD